MLLLLLVTQWCLTLCDPMDYGLAGSSVRGILQARILEWVAISFSRNTSIRKAQIKNIIASAGKDMRQ